MNCHLTILMPLLLCAGLCGSPLLFSGGGGVVILAKIDLCGVCGKRVKVNCVRCMTCKKWIHARCARVKSFS